MVQAANRCGSAPLTPSAGPLLRTFMGLQASYSYSYSYSYSLTHIARPRGCFCSTPPSPPCHHTTLPPPMSLKDTPSVPRPVSPAPLSPGHFFTNLIDDTCFLYNILQYFFNLICTVGDSYCDHFKRKIKATITLRLN